MLQRLVSPALLRDRRLNALAELSSEGKRVYAKRTGIKEGISSSTRNVSPMNHSTLEDHYPQQASIAVTD